MKKVITLLVMVLMAACTGNDTRTQAPQTAEPSAQIVRVEQTISRQGTKSTSQGAVANFTGIAIVESIHQPTGASRMYAAYVTFEAGARTNWHSHPLGQTLIVTDGTAWTQDEFGNTHAAHVGDVIHCPPDVIHWHGASPDAKMTHVAVAERADGASVTWLDKVTDEQYKQAGIAIKEQR